MVFYFLPPSRKWQQEGSQQLFCQGSPSWSVHTFLSSLSNCIRYPQLRTTRIEALSPSRSLLAGNSSALNQAKLGWTENWGGGFCFVMPMMWPHGRESNSPLYREEKVIQHNKEKVKLMPAEQSQLCRNEHSGVAGMAGRVGEWIQTCCFTKATAERG